MASLGKMLVLLGLMVAALGLVLWGFPKLPLLGRLPGDIYIRRGNFAFYFPLGTCILISIVISLLMMLLRR